MRAFLIVSALPFVLPFAGCDRTPKNLTLTVMAIEKTPPPDAGPWKAKLVEMKTTTDPQAIATVRDAVAAAKKGTAIRCTFLEGGEPSGLKFEVSPDKSTVWVHGQRAVAMAGHCYELDAGARERLRDVARSLSVPDPGLD